MDKYENGKIYKIVDNTNNNIYIGHTTEKYLSKRLQHHLYQYKYWKEGKKTYTSSFKIFENNDYRIELLENCNCKDVYELKNRERYYIENNDCVNLSVPNRTKLEWKNHMHLTLKEILIKMIIDQLISSIRNPLDRITALSMAKRLWRT